MNKENVAVSCRKERMSSDKTKLILPIEHPKEWEEVVQSLISSNVWLQKHGLAKKNLTLNQILSTIGFKFHEKTDETLEKPAASHNGRAILSKVLKSNGKACNISCSRDKLYNLEKQLLHAIYLFKRRIEWLTTKSRRMFGVIEEDSVTIVLDYDSIPQQRFDQYKTALENVLRQQVSKLSKFNLIRACEDLQFFSSVCVPVSHNNIENAVDWIWNLDGGTSVSSTACAEALLKALSDNQNESVYLFTEGSSINKAKQILAQKVCSKENTIPVHVVSFNCDCSNTIKYLREFAELANGRFHAYGVVVETDAYELPPVDGAPNTAHTVHKCQIQGGVPAGAGVRKDVVLVFEEMEEARSILEQIQILAEIYPTLSVSTKDEDIAPDSSPSRIKEKYVDSKEWLKSNGLEASGLGWHEILSALAFRHADGVVDLMHPPAEETARDAIVEQKLVNARYCDELFPVVKLNDGEIFHVLVTPDIYRKCKEKIQGVLNKIQKRIDWLNKGSRSLFGTLVEEHVYILLDISASMQPSLNFVKQKLFILMQEQLRHKKKFNIVAFNTKVVAWKDRIADVSEQSMQSAWSWVRSLSCWGSTNTNAALQTALADPRSQAIYLLTDGRPDQPPSSIIGGVQMHKNIPIHTISFNCNDAEANGFLYDLAETTGGRFHCYSEKGKPLSQPKAWESMDIKDLKTEINIGLENLKELSRLRDESSRLVWKRGADDLKKSFNSSSSVENSFSSVKKISGSLGVTSNTNKHSVLHSLHRRPISAPSSVAATVLFRNPVPPFNQPKTVQRQRRLRHRNQDCGSLQGSNSAEVSYLGQRKGYMYHTRTGSGRFSPNEWMLLESKVLFQKQANKQEDTIGNPAYSTRHHKPVHSFQEVQKTPDSFVGQKKNLTTKEWLSRHSLAAKHLTIMDVLRTTCVSHKTKYVKILDKFISGKVFEEIMPMAFVSGGNRMHFVNPNGVDLRAYEKKVRDAMAAIKKYLDLSVWEALPQSAKQEFDSNKPVSFENNRAKILTLLKETDWSVTEEDISNLEEEIETGKKYIKQSRALRKASGEEIDDEDTESSSTGTSRSSSVSRSVSSDVSTKGSRVSVFK